MPRFFTPSLFTLIGVNVGVIVLAVVQAWDVGTLLWAYWFQSIVIGIFTAIKMRTFAHATMQRVFFFVFHYGTFHVVYMLFLAAFGTAVDWRAVFFAALSFLLQ